MQAVIRQDDLSRLTTAVQPPHLSGGRVPDAALSALVDALDKAIRRQNRQGAGHSFYDGGGS